MNAKGNGWASMLEPNREGVIVFYTPRGSRSPWAPLPARMVAGFESLHALVDLIEVNRSRSPQPKAVAQLITTGCDISDEQAIRANLMIDPTYGVAWLYNTAPVNVDIYRGWDEILSIRHQFPFDGDETSKDREFARLLLHTGIVA
jgi:hypothetical protein